MRTRATSSSERSHRPVRDIRLRHILTPFLFGALLVQALICFSGLLNSVRRSNLDRYIVSLKQKAREGAGKRALSTVSPSAANKQMTKVFISLLSLPCRRSIIRSSHPFTSALSIRRGREVGRSEQGHSKGACATLSTSFALTCTLRPLARTLSLMTATMQRTLLVAAVHNVQAAWH
jgi:hypothetical protein